MDRAGYSSSANAAGSRVRRNKCGNNVQTIRDSPGSGASLAECIPIPRLDVKHDQLDASS